MKVVSKIGKFISILILSILVIGVISFVVYLVIPSPQKTVRSFFLNIKLEKYKKAYALIDGNYLLKRGSLEKFTDEYFQAVQTGTRTKKIVISNVKPGKKPNQKIVSVNITVFYTGADVETKGSYLVEKIPGKGWRIVDNVTSQESKINNSQLPKAKP